MPGDLNLKLRLTADNKGFVGEVRVPAQGGRAQEQTFTAHFRLVPAQELKEIQDDGNDVTFLRRVLAGWDDIQDANGKPLKFNDANLEKLADINYFATAVGNAYAAFGIALPAPARQAFPVLPENWDTVRAFCAVQTQWRYGPSGHPTGLDYAGCKAAVRAMGLKWRRVFAGLRVMEGEVLDGFSRGD